MGVLLVLLGASGCARTNGIGFTFSDPPRAERSVGRVVWLEPIRIAAPGVPEREAVEVAWTYNAARYLRQRELFGGVRVGPGEIEADAWIARLRIERIDERTRRTLRGVLFPPQPDEPTFLSFKLGELRFDAEATLEFLDASGATLASTRQRQAGSLALYARNESNRHAFFLDQRRRLLDALFDAALRELR